MGSTTSISWCDATLNLAYGCRKVDSACENCYMFRLLNRSGKKQRVIPIEYKMTIEQACNALEKWPKSKRFVFVNSMSDTFHEDIPDHVIENWHANVFNAFPERTFLLLTKRIGRAMVFYRGIRSRFLEDENIWVGCSIGEKARLRRLDQLREIEARVRFVSFEPLIEDLGDFSLESIQWAIVGGESGNGKQHLRKMEPEWAERIRRICERDRVDFWFKQLGGYGGDGAGGDILNGFTYHNRPSHEKPEPTQIPQPTLEVFA